MKIIEALNWRYATKKFDPKKKIGTDDWKILEESMRLSPSSFGLQPWKIYVVQDQKLKDKLLPHSWNQQQVVECSHLVVIAFHKSPDSELIGKYLERICEVRGATLDNLEGYKQVMEGALSDGPLADISNFWSQRQSYILMGFLLMAAAELGIDSCPMEGIVPEQYNEILDVDPQYSTVAAVPLGYRHTDDKYAGAPKVRFEAKDIFVYK